MKQELLFVVLFLSLFGSAYASDDPIVWSYSEGWWENTTPDPEDNCVQDPNQLSAFSVCDNARFTFISRETAELNPEVNAHGIEINVQIEDLYNNQIVSDETTLEYWTGTQTLFSTQAEHEVSDWTDTGPFEGRMNIEVSCNGSMPGGSGTIATGGWATLSFRLLNIVSPNRAFYQHIHNPSSTCPSRCRDSVVWAQVVYEGTPGPYATVIVPFTIITGCSSVGAGFSSPLGVCFDVWVVL